MITDAPLKGITVLEVGVFMAGPFATMQMADLGARVIKIENPNGGDQTRETGPFVNGESAPFARLNRGKESVAIDLKSPAGKAQMWALMQESDVLVENLRPGAMSRLGFGYEDVSKKIPGLIYASGSGWGQDGPLSNEPGLDIMAQARSGIMSVTGFADRPPAKAGVPLCDLTTGLYLALAVTAAILERSRSGLGQHIDVSLLESGVSLAIWEAGAYFSEGKISKPLGSAHGHQAPYQAIKCANGYMTVGANTQQLWERFARAIDIAECIDDERFRTPPARVKNREALIKVIEQRTSYMSVDDVIEAVRANGVPVAPIQDYGQVFNDVHLNERDFFWDSPHPTMGTVRQIGSPMRLSRTPVRRGSAGPVLGDATDKVFTEFKIEEVEGSPR